MGGGVRNNPNKNNDLSAAGNLMGSNNTSNNLMGLATIPTISSNAISNTNTIAMDNNTMLTNTTTSGSVGGNTTDTGAGKMNDMSNTMAFIDFPMEEFNPSNDLLL